MAVSTNWNVKSGSIACVIKFKGHSHQFTDHSRQFTGHSHQFTGHYWDQDYAEAYIILLRILSSQYLAFRLGTWMRRPAEKGKIAEGMKMSVPPSRRVVPIFTYPLASLFITRTALAPAACAIRTFREHVRSVQNTFKEHSGNPRTSLFTRIRLRVSMKLRVTGDTGDTICS
jgi:hypothetical protein